MVCNSSITTHHVFIIHHVRYQRHPFTVMRTYNLTDYPPDSASPYPMCSAPKPWIPGEVSRPLVVIKVVRPRSLLFGVLAYLSQRRNESILMVASLHADLLCLLVCLIRQFALGRHAHWLWLRMHPMIITLARRV